MPDFLELHTPTDALAKWLPQIRELTGSEEIATSEALGRTLAEDIFSSESLPAFRRSTMDGYAVRANDTHGASQSLPVYLKVIGEVKMSGEGSFILKTGDCVLIHTGGMLPDSADAVVRLEDCQSNGEGQIEVGRSVGVGENVIQRGEDLMEGDLVLPTGSTLRPMEIGGLMALGKTKIRVKMAPKIGILSTGDELIAPHKKPKHGEIRDVNSYLLASLMDSEGASARRMGVFSDDLGALIQHSKEAMEKYDALVISAGSSASKRDYSAEIISALGEPGVLVHGINIRPGKPTILGIANGKAIIGLPGNPVSAYVIAWLFTLPMLDRLLGKEAAKSPYTISAEISGNLSSSSGREDWVAVKLTKRGGKWIADPVHSRSNLIFSLVRADGLVRIAPESNGLASMSIVDVVLLR